MSRGHLCVGGPLDGQLKAHPDGIRQFNVVLTPIDPFDLFDIRAANEVCTATIKTVTYTLTRIADGSLIWQA